MSTTNKALTFHAGPALAAITASYVKEIGGTSYTVTVADLSDQSLAYLAEYGYAQSMGDTKALSALEKAKQAEKAGVFPTGFTEKLETSNATSAMTAFFAANEGAKAAYVAWEGPFLAARAEARYKAILAGEMVFGSSERLSPEEKDRREIVTGMIKEAVAKAGKKMPKDAETLNKVIAHVYAQKQGEVDKEVARRAKARVAHGTTDLDLGDFT